MKTVFVLLSLVSFLAALVLIPLALINMTSSLRPMAGAVYLDVFLLLGGVVALGMTIVFRGLGKRFG